MKEDKEQTSMPRSFRALGCKRNEATFQFHIIVCSTESWCLGTGGMCLVATVGGRRDLGEPEASSHRPLMLTLALLRLLVML